MPEDPTPHTRTLTNTPSPQYSLPGIRDRLGITLQLFHVAQELFEEALAG